MIHVYGTKVEIYCATAETWGYILMIRTGPWEFSKMFVTRLKARGYVPEKGMVHRGDAVVPVPDERIAFRMAGIGYCEPDLR